ncbi:beta-1,4-galactosyltransferase 2-like [Bombina bombina]|uniref:beta-1,4-galactosyltransferase 2-like n=1 Tax=Bombina bombina TaxID=8345 RepID=UPI00235AC143|nr:beta-1,4-galactosyltransferase 2-like [Bombina bombina]
MSLCRKQHYRLILLIVFFIFALITLKTHNMEKHLGWMKKKAQSQLNNSMWLLCKPDPEMIEETQSLFPTCPEMPPGLGPLKVDPQENVSIDKILLENENLQFGGHGKPAICNARQKVAIIIPYRNREPHLNIWLRYMHPFLQKQQADYGVYIVEQHGDEKFNRAKLMNIGFVEALKEYDYDCFMFHDVDIIPIDSRHLYRCKENPRHMANAQDRHNYRLFYSTAFGGIVGFSREQYLKVNGFSNLFWGWGKEDDELYQRVFAVGMTVDRADENIAKSKAILHTRDKGNEENKNRFQLMHNSTSRMHSDGLNSLKYDIISFTKHKLYTKLVVDIGHPETTKP